jgi:hypothetical protein
MKRPTSVSLETFALRVQVWFDKDKEGMLHQVISASKSQEFCKKHKCDPIKTLRILSQADYLTLQGYLFSRSKKQIKKRHVTQGTLAKPLQVALDPNEGSGIDLCQKRVARYQFREQCAAFKRLKRISHTSNEGSKQYQASTIASSQQEENAPNPFLEECAKFKEERHFQLGRVIKYLID